MIENRADFSRFLVHLTKNGRGKSARENLIQILKQKTIEARNIHCLFHYKIKKFNSDALRNQFKTVCLTETPLDQIHNITSDNIERNVKLKPYGLVFWRDVLLEKGASPAIYINAKGTSLDKYLIDSFDNLFNKVKTLKALKKKESEHYKEIARYYALVNTIKDTHDFSWEREWRHLGDLKFMYKDIVAIVCEEPDELIEACIENKFSATKLRFIKRIPLISSDWNYEQVIEELSCKIWKMHTE